MANPTPSEVNADTASASDEAAIDLSAMTRAELDAYAGEQGMADAASYPNKAALIEALEAAELDADAAPDEGDQEGGNTAEPRAEAAPGEARYRVLKAITLDTGQTLMPGEDMTIGPDWPSRRAGQLMQQKYLRPINDQARGAAKALTAEGEDDGDSIQDED